jgi:filamentous hemagglutinin family protein
MSGMKPHSQDAFDRRLIAVAVASCFSSGLALANPTGPTVVSGSAAIVANGNLLQITNTPHAIINWQSFSIGASELTRFLQQSTSSAVLNRVITQNPSSILGALQSNGRVFLINPNGILFGAGAQIDVAGLVASTLGLSDSDFLAGRLKFTEVPGAGSVVNQGNLTTPQGGQVYLVGSSVTNSGIITSPKGEVILAAGNSVELVNPGTPNLRVEITAPDSQAVSLGQIVADSGRVGIYAGLINHSGTIRADSAQLTDDGRIILKATKNVTLEPSSVLSASGAKGGEIFVLAGDTVQVAGRLDASAPNGGDGGFIETSGAKVRIDPAAIITTSAPYGKTGTWLVDPNDYTIALADGDITGAQLSTNLGSNNVVISSDNGATTGNGDIFVNDTVSWSNSNSLTLLARRNVDISSISSSVTVENSGTGDVNLYAGWNGNTGTPGVNSGTGDINLSSATIRTGGNILLKAGKDISLDNNSRLSSQAPFAVTRDNTVTLHAVGGTIRIVDDSYIEATGGAPHSELGGFGGKGTVTLMAANGITLEDACGECGGGRIYAYGGNGSNGNGGNAVISLDGGAGDIKLKDGSVLHAEGGDAGGSGDGGKAIISLTTTGNIEVRNNSSLYARGGSTDTDGGSGGNATVTLTSTGSSGIGVSNSTVHADGGEGSIGGAAKVTLTANGGGGITVINSDIYAYGGGPGYYNGGGGSAVVELNAGGTITVQGSLSEIKAAGGDGYSTTGGAAAITLAAGTGITIDGAEARAYGGYGSSANGGSATITLDGGTGPVLLDNGGTLNAYGGDVGGSNGNGGESLISVATSGGITVRSNSEIYSSGGTDYYGTGNGGDATTVLATGGNFLITDSSVRAKGGDSGEGGGVPGVGTTALFGSTITIGGGSGVTGVYGTNVSLAGTVINATGGTSSGASTTVEADGALNVLAVIGLNVLGGLGSGTYSVLKGSNNAVVIAGGNVNITGGNGAGASAAIMGSPDVNLLVGGSVNLQAGNGSGAYAQIAAGNPTTITLDFPLLASGGYFVNGVEGAVTNGTTGFFADGSPAVLGQNLMVTYCGSGTCNGGTTSPPPAVDQALNQVVAATNQQTNVLQSQDPTGDTGAGTPEVKEKKKELPVCK